MTEQHSESAKSLEIPAEHFSITLGQFSLWDAGVVFKLINENRKHLSQFGDKTADKYRSLRSVEESIINPKNPKRLRFGIWNDKREFVGSINLTPDEDNPKRAEIGYYLGSEFTGKGYMLRALLTLSTHAFYRGGYEELYGKVFKDNSQSVKVLEKAGFRETGTEGEDRIYTLTKPKE